MAETKTLTVEEIEFLKVCDEETAIATVNNDGFATSVGLIASALSGNNFNKDLVGAITLAGEMPLYSSRDRRKLVSNAVSEKYYSQDTEPNSPWIGQLINGLYAERFNTKSSMKWGETYPDRAEPICKLAKADLITNVAEYLDSQPESTLTKFNAFFVIRYVIEKLGEMNITSKDQVLEDVMLSLNGADAMKERLLEMLSVVDTMYQEHKAEPTAIDGIVWLAVAGAKAARCCVIC